MHKIYLSKRFECLETFLDKFALSKVNTAFKIRIRSKPQLVLKPDNFIK